jgi:hypothetical protein
MGRGRPAFRLNNIQLSGYRRVDNRTKALVVGGGKDKHFLDAFNDSTHALTKFVIGQEVRPHQHTYFLLKRVRLK